ncbi:hypothetical protein WR25_17523 isoform A [Diploscapter pachys]|uniref:RRM domain-containing protein n=1 Tax=Diploscapter pachys TaxID=2018661 RepID=A0A2A2L6J8_9BILA|nr:hypothetical protein WR25_17523 isoform A [Diploscapter pachys]
MKNGEKDLKIKQLEEKMDKLQSRLDKLLTIEELRDENENKTLSSLFDDANDNLDEWKEYRSQWQEYGKEIEEWKEILKKPNELKLEDLPEIQQFKEWAREKEKGYEKADANDAENNAKKKSRRQQNKQSNHDNVDPTKVFIRNIGSSVTKEILRDKFSAWGQIEFVFVGYDRQTNAHLSYGWVRYKNAESARQAIQMMHNTYICGDQISVKPGLINPPSKKTE